MVSYIKIEQKNYMLSKAELERRNLAYVYCELCGRRVYLVGRQDVIEELKGKPFITVTVEEEKKYKPIDMYMRMQQGKMGRTYTTNVTYRARIYNEINSPQRHIIYCII